MLSVGFLYCNGRLEMRHNNEGVDVKGFTIAPIKLPENDIESIRTELLNEFRKHPEGETILTAIPDEPPSLVITVSAELAFRKHRCENTP